MSRKTKARVLLPLLARLRACPAREIGYSGPMLIEAWERVRKQTVNQIPALSVMGALILDSHFGDLLKANELAQFFALARVALERWETKNKTNQVGKLLFDCIQEEK